MRIARSSNTGSWLAFAACVLLTATDLVTALSVHEADGSGSWSGGGYLFNALFVTALLSFPAVGLLIAIKGHGGVISRLLLAIGVSWGIANTTAYPDRVVHARPGDLLADILAVAGSCAWLPAIGLTGTFLILLFPDGRLPSRRWRPVLAAYLVIAVATAVICAVAVLQVAIGHRVVLQPDGNLASLGLGRTAYAGLIMGVYLLCAGALWLAAVVRQALSWRHLKRTEPDGERRQQLKWLASGAAVCGVLGISAVSTNSSIWEVLILGFAALPLSIGIGILKYRLYEIDRLISRTLAYAIVTGLLVGVYAGLVLLSTHVFTVHGTVAVAASTLAAAALFTPLRRRVQHAVDRRFNRARYDADQTIAAFAAHLNDAVDLDSVRTDLTAVVHRALEPAHVSLWLTPRD